MPVGAAQHLGLVGHKFLPIRRVAAGAAAVTAGRRAEPAEDTLPGASPTVLDTDPRIRAVGRPSAVDRFASPTSRPRPERRPTCRPGAPGRPVAGTTCRVAHTTNCNRRRPSRPQPTCPRRGRRRSVRQGDRCRHRVPTTVSSRSSASATAVASFAGRLRSCRHRSVRICGRIRSQLCD